MAATNPTSKRRQQRYDVDFALELTFDGESFEARARNMSVGGMFLDTVATLPFGATIGLKFSISTLKDPIAVQAQVRWLDKHSDHTTGAGVQFIGLRAKHVWALNKFFENKKPSG